MFFYLFASYLKAPSTPPPIQEGVDLWRSRFLIHTTINHDMMMSKADRQVYKSLAQFQMDSETIVHNVTIFHGGMIYFRRTLNYLILN